MSADPAPVERFRARQLRAIERACSCLTVVEDLEVAGIGFALAEWLKDGARAPLDIALGLRGGPGSRTAATESMLAQRNALIARAAVEFWPGLSTSAQAAGLHRAWSRYAASGWPRERTATSVPSARLGKVEALFFQIMRLRDDVISESRVRKILATS